MRPIRLVLLVLFSSIGPATAGEPPVRFAPNHLFVTSFNTSEVHEYQPDGTFLATYDASSSLTGPEGIAFGPDGLLYICASSDDEVQAIDAEDSLQLTFDAGGNIDAPNGIAFGPFGHLFIVSRATDRIVVVDGDDVVRTTLGGGTAIDTPQHLAFSPDGLLYVTSNATDEVYRFTPDGTSLTPWTFGLLSAPIGVAFSPDGQLRVSSRGNDAIMVSPKDPTLYFTAGDAALDAPFGLVTGPDGRLYVASENTDRVVVFDGPSVVADVGAGEGLSGLGGVAFSPFLFKVKLSGELKDTEGDSTKVKGTGTLAWSPGSCRMSVTMVDDPDDQDDFASSFGSDTLVLHGQEGGDGKKRVFTGLENPGADKFFRITTAILDVRGKLDANGFFVPKKVTGTFSRTGVKDGAQVFRGTIKSVKRLN